MLIAVTLSAALYAHAQDDALPPPPIVNGSPTSDYTFVGALMACGGSRCGTFCSGSLVDRQWVVTAAHCVDAVDEYDRYGYDIYFGVGADESSLTDYAQAVEWHTHPSWSGTDASELSNDIGVVKLSGGISSVAPVALNTERVNNAWIGDELTYVGFGITSDNANDSGVKRTVDLPVYTYDSNFIYTLDTDNGRNLCSGDSGGAGLRMSGGDWTLAGVNSFVFAYSSSSTSCVGGGAGASRVDEYVDWVEAYVGGGGETDADTDADSDTDTDADTDADTDSDADTDQQDPELSWGSTTGKDYGQLSTCSAVQPSRWSLVLGLLSLVAVARRRR